MAADYERDLIQVTCASGKQGSHLLLRLSPKFKHFRLACSSSASADGLRNQCPNTEVFQANLAEPSACRSLFHGVTAVFHIGPSFHLHETEIGYNTIDAAVAEAQTLRRKFQPFVYSSALQSVFRKTLNRDGKRYVEEHLMETDTNWTIVQPSHFMDVTRPTIAGFATATEPELVYTAGFNPKTRFSSLALQYLGEAATRIIEQCEKHFFGLYPFVSMEMPMSYAGVFEVVEKVMGKPVNIRRRSFEEAVGGILKMLTGGGVREMHPRTTVAAERMVLFYNRRGLVGSPDVLEMVLGRRATSYENWVRGVVKDARSKP